MIQLQTWSVWAKLNVIEPLRRRYVDDRGASLVEYALLVALIAVVCIAAITLLGNNAKTKFSTVAGSIN